MIAHADTLVTAFADNRILAAGLLAAVLPTLKAAHDGDEPFLVFDDASALPVELDLRGSLSDALARLDRPEPKGPGRPKLGVTAREVTMLPRHWEWLSGQPGGASVALRRLVDEARRDGRMRDRIREAQESANRFMAAMAGDLPRFEDASRALFSGDADRFDSLTDGWPEDIRDHSRRLAAAAFSAV